MSRVTPTLPLSHIIASDAPLLSPVSPGMGQADFSQLPLYSPDLGGYLHFGNYYGLPSPSNSAGSTSTNSPTASNKMLKNRMSPESMSDGDRLCIPTHQVFDFPEFQHPPSPDSSSPSPQMRRRSVSVTSTTPSKREHSPAPGATKKARSSGERITTKDFIPPDVSGLSKREARLVKNRAAAFLSRQRKREEFETMEVRVAELEHENATLRALTQNGSAPAAQMQNDSQLRSEVEQLRAQLAQSKEREQQLSAELERRAQAQDTAIKMETASPPFSPSPARTVPVSSPHKPGASLGLMVLLCALPTLLSMPSHSNVPTSYSYPTSGPALMAPPTFDFNSIIPSEFDWTRTPSGTMMDLDVDEQGRITTSSDPSNVINASKLEFVDGNAEALGLGDLDISFDASPSENGKIRVRIHSSAGSAPSSSAPKSTPRHRSSSSSSLSMWAGSPNMGAIFSPPSFSSALAPPSTSDRDPFLGANTAFGLGSPMSVPMSIGDFSSPVGLSHHSMYSLGSMNTKPANSKRRVKISLKSMPSAAGEGGEWEVEVR